MSDALQYQILVLHREALEVEWAHPEEERCPQEVEHQVYQAAHQAVS